MNLGVPKALVQIAGEPCLTTTLQRIGHKFRRVFVVTNILARDQWRSYFQHLDSAHPELAQRVCDLPTLSGLGDGHAALQGLLAAEQSLASPLAQDIVVTWGDVFFQHAEIVDELMSTDLRGSGLFPAVLERSPYVALRVDELMQCVSVDFSKYGENHPMGLHDQSVFRFCRPKLKASLRSLHDSLWKGGRYMTQGGELSLLYSAHQLYNSGDPLYVYETKYRTLAFNTVEEVASIQQEIRSRAGASAFAL